MPNLSALAPITTAAQALSNLILVSPQATQGYQPQNKPDPTGRADNRQQPPALLFQYEGEQSVTLESDIPDHYVEDNTAVQDQIALKPEMVTTRGFIGELNDVVPKGLSFVKFAADKLTTIAAYTPELSATALIAYQEAFFLYQVTANAVDAAVSSWSSLTGSGGENVIGSDGISGFDAATGEIAGSQNKQQTAFQQFYGYWRNKTLFTIQTPWAVFQNMAIKTLRPVQDAETRVVTEFEVTFKMIRFASTVTTTGISAIFQGRSSTQASGLTNVGTSAPVDSIPLSGGLSSMVG